MTTAVQPSELVFEFASNGMDEINQVSTTREEPYFVLFNTLIIVSINNWACSLHRLFDPMTFVPAARDSSIPSRCTVCDLANKCKTCSRANSLCKKKRLPDQD